MTGKLRIRAGSVSTPECRAKPAAGTQTVDFPCLMQTSRKFLVSADNTLLSLVHEQHIIHHEERHATDNVWTVLINVAPGVRVAACSNDHQKSTLVTPDDLRREREQRAARG